jgi:hypothetical protein
VKLVFYNNMNRLIFVFYLFIVLSYVLCVFFFLNLPVFGMAYLQFFLNC